MTRFFLALFGRVAFASIITVSLILALARLIPVEDNELIFSADLRTGYEPIYRADISHRLILRLTPEDSIYGGLAWSPDGQSIAAYNADSYAIDLVNPNGAGAQPMLPPGYDDIAPTWSPDSQSLAFIRQGGISKHLMIINLHTSDVYSINDSLQLSNDTAWSPDGRFIAYTYKPDELGRVTIDVHDFQNGTDYPLMNADYNQFFPSWSHDGSRLLFWSSGEHQGFYIWDRASQSITRLYSTDPYITSTPDWSPDNRYIVYSGLDPNSYIVLWRLEVAACLSADAPCKPDRLSFRRGDYSNPRWRPNIP